MSTKVSNSSFIHHIRGGRIIDPKNGINQIGDLWLVDGLIHKIVDGLCSTPASKMSPPISNPNCLDASGLLVVPGLFDMLVHLREPGFEHKETIETGTKSAVKGGFTTVACMANTNPTGDCVKVIEWVKNRARTVGSATVHPIGTITKNLDGLVKSDWVALKEAGIVALSDDGKTVMDTQIMQEALRFSAQYGLPIIDHCEDHHLTANTVMNLGEVSKRLGLPGQPNSSEDIIIARDILLSEQTGGHIHIAHVSTEGGVDLIRWAKQRGISVTAEACGRHFTITETEIEKSGTNAKMHPPLRTQKDVDAVKQGLADGTIDAIVTDHAPHADFEKKPPSAEGIFEREMMDAPAGIVGLETNLPLALTKLKKYLSLPEIIAKMSYIPAEILKIDCGTLSIGAIADVTLIDPDLNKVVDPSTFASKSKNTPFTGWELTGWPVATIRQGKLVWSSDQFNCELDINKN